MELFVGTDENGSAKERNANLEELIRRVSGPWIVMGASFERSMWERVSACFPCLMVFTS